MARNFLVLMLMFTIGSCISCAKISITSNNILALDVANFKGILNQVLEVSKMKAQYEGLSSMDDSNLRQSYPDRLNVWVIYERLNVDGPYETKSIEVELTSKIFVDGNIKYGVRIEDIPNSNLKDRILKIFAASSKIILLK